MKSIRLLVFRLFIKKKSIEKERKRKKNMGERPEINRMIWKER